MEWTPGEETRFPQSLLGSKEMPAWQLLKVPARRRGSIIRVTQRTSEAASGSQAL